MKLNVTVDVVYAEGRILVVTSMDGSPQNLVDVSALDVGELDQALGMAMRSLRRQLLERVYPRLPVRDSDIGH